MLAAHTSQSSGLSLDALSISSFVIASPCRDVPLALLESAHELFPLLVIERTRTFSQFDPSRNPVLYSRISRLDRY